MKFQNRPTVAAVALASVALVGGTIALPGTTAAATPSEVSAKRSGEYEPNNNLTEAPELPTGPFNAGLETAQDLDYYKFYIADPGTDVTIQINATSPNDGSFITMVSIMDAEGQSVDYDVLAKFLMNTAVGATLEPGRYYLALEPTSMSTATATYTASSVGTFTPEATMVANCTAAKTDLSAAKKKVRKIKKKIKAADTKRELRKLKRKLRKQKKVRKAAQAQTARYCVVP